MIESGNYALTLLGLGWKKRHFVDAEPGDYVLFPRYRTKCICN